jgi:hypothetical protein
VGIEIPMKHRTSRLDVMYYFKAAFVIGDGVGLEDYFEADSEGVLQRVVSHDGDRWWASVRDHNDADEVRLSDFAGAQAITVEEFERAWHLAVAERAPDPV